MAEREEVIAVAAGRHDAEARIARARALAGETAATAEMLSFYADIVTEQQRLLALLPPPALGVDVPSIAALAPAFLDWLRRAAPESLAGIAMTLARDEVDWPALFDRYWTSPQHDVSGAEEAHLFVVEAVLQPFVEAFARAGGAAFAGSRGCPACGSRPLVAVLREQGHGSRRTLVCGLCLSEFTAPRVTCPACDEQRAVALPIYSAEQFPGVRVDGCDTCRTYIKTFDLSERGHAVPVVDDLATLPLDLWAQEQGYRKIRPNLLRL